jgi:hypothetical protein
VSLNHPRSCATFAPSRLHHRRLFHSTGPLLRRHPAWQPGQAQTAAEGGADRRSAKNAAAPLPRGVMGSPPKPAQTEIRHPAVLAGRFTAAGGAATYRVDQANCQVNQSSRGLSLPLFSQVNRATRTPRVDTRPPANERAVEGVVRLLTPITSAAPTMADRATVAVPDRLMASPCHHEGCYDQKQEPNCNR